MKRARTPWTIAELANDMHRPASAVREGIARMLLEKCIVVAEGTMRPKSYILAPKFR